MEDMELLERWRGGDQSAGNQLFERHFDSVYRFFARKTADDAAGDLVQRTFLACLGAQARFRQESSFRTFLFSIARHELYGFWRQRKKRDDLDFTVSSVEDLGPSPSRVVADKREQRLLLEALRMIPLELQVAIELYYWEGLRAPELAQVLEIPEGTVRSRLRRAKEALRDRMAELAQGPVSVESVETTFHSLQPKATREAS